MAGGAPGVAGGTLEQYMQCSVSVITRATIMRSKLIGGRLPNCLTIPLRCLCFDRISVPVVISVL